jgi:hypothetical protein
MLADRIEHLNADAVPVFLILLTFAPILDQAGI